MRPQHSFLVSTLLVALALVACGASNTATPTTAPTQNTAVTATATRPPATNAPTNTVARPTNAPPATSIPPTATASPTQPAPTNTRAASANNSFTIGADPLITDLRRPVLITHAGDGSGRLFIVEQPGRILIAKNGRMRETPFLDIRSKITTASNEQGLLGLAFHPDYQNNGQFFVNYSRKGDGDNVIARYQVSDDANVADANSEQILLVVPGEEPNHNGGMIEFGRDGYLYIATGDGGGGGDRHGKIGYGQDLNSLLGKILRIDVDGTPPYDVPANNPFVNRPDAQPEIWAYGLRNPWRFSIDRATGDLYIGDVGQSSVEEINFQPASSGGGENYGWRIMEGDECYDESQDCNRADLIAPIATYSHDLGCSITGGYVYRGQMYPFLAGQYLFADYCSGIVWASARDANGEWQTHQVGQFDDTLSSFGQDEQGELYVVGHGNGAIYKLTASR